MLLRSVELAGGYTLAKKLFNLSCESNNAIIASWLWGALHEHLLERIMMLNA